MTDNPATRRAPVQRHTAVPPFGIIAIPRATQGNDHELCMNLYMPEWMIQPLPKTADASKSPAQEAPGRATPERERRLRMDRRRVERRRERAPSRPVPATSSGELLP